MKDFNICIEAFVRWEQLTGRSFNEFDYSSVDDIHRLLYCAYVINTQAPTTFEVFLNTLQINARLYKKALKDVAQHNIILAQFQAEATDVESVEPIEDVPSPTIGDITARLIITGGLDARYVMREMALCDLPRYIKALDDKIRQEAESQRMWTYLSILPHVSRNSLQSPQKLITFPWEAAEAKAKAQQVAEEMADEFKAFMNHPKQ